ncbi:BadF/BadG/BcrA/BcrD ATPase family protein [Spiroplasma endosymbiont of Aspidapion aeneum]|uniref:BadF/BadG/BcrA/BcrD ATPase family protein n=1 Tax=Spiroplasma endosymbiont of Aspidapion aeneum TaxID=3066276 RepID=UPI00313CD903
MTIYIDGGATSTKVYYKKDGKIQILFHTNRMNITTNESQALKNIIDCFEQISNEISTNNNMYYLGISGFINYDVNKITGPLFKRFDFLNKNNIKIMIDVEMQLYLNIGDDFINENFVYIACGTGSNTIECYNKKWKTVGGWGYFFGDEGSAYDFSKEWIIMALKAFDKNRENKFTKSVCDFFNIKNPSQITELYKTPNMVKNYLADFCVYLVEENHKKYKEEIEIVMAKIATNMSTYLNGMIDFEKHKTVYLYGGLFKNKLYYDTLTKSLNADDKTTKFIKIT